MRISGKKRVNGNFPPAGLPGPAGRRVRWRPRPVMPGPDRRCATLWWLRGSSPPRDPGRLAQRESASFTPRRSLVRSQYRPPGISPGQRLQDRPYPSSEGGPSGCLGGIWEINFSLPPRGDAGCQVPDGGAGGFGVHPVAAVWGQQLVEQGTGEWGRIAARARSESPSGPGAARRWPAHAVHRRRGGTRGGRSCSAGDACRPERGTGTGRCRRAPRRRCTAGAGCSGPGGRAGCSGTAGGLPEGRAPSPDCGRSRPSAGSGRTCRRHRGSATRPGSRRGARSRAPGR
jgi:hypothetical protein